MSALKNMCQREKKIEKSLETKSSTVCSLQYKRIYEHFLHCCLFVPLMADLFLKSFRITEARACIIFSRFSSVFPRFRFVVAKRKQKKTNAKSTHCEQIQLCRATSFRAQYAQHSYIVWAESVDNKALFLIFPCRFKQSKFKIRNIKAALRSITIWTVCRTFVFEWVKWIADRQITALVPCNYFPLQISGKRVCTTNRFAHHKFSSTTNF